MNTMVTLIARTAPLERELPMESRPATEADIPALGKLYFNAYDPGEASESLKAAAADIDASLAGKYGTFLPAASQVVPGRDGNIDAAILVVERAVWDDTPETPFIIELITDPEHRRQGLAEQLVLTCMDILFNAGHPEVALRVDSTNSAALALYLSLDFRRWSADD
ncbi:N-acetyltransferase [Paenarthrobacter sp. Z7-10]|uniref:GNAT family N-acetyltransferase n=1 Tax=Paenarthrobacter sp. Z7-10 TaxID=2787635 RepID=UPI0022A944CF|nr:GNAT family N-acetyltransferase [Paenarthrobacter sp. Z7-10]MCZ2404494.1 N-acetyltransferase [Paenarthrobacter sp. Z7-10]